MVNSIQECEKSQLELSLDNFDDQRQETESTGAHSTLKLSQHMTCGSGDSAGMSVKLDDSFEDLADDYDYKEFHKITEQGFVEITIEEINKVPEPIKITNKTVLDFK